MTTAQLDLFGPPPMARARKDDPRTAKVASALNPEGRATQAQRILRYLQHYGQSSTVTADACCRSLTFPGEDIARGEWSSRLGVLVHRGLLERAGEVTEDDRHGRARQVLAYRLTDDGRAEVDRMFGGVA